MTITTKFTHMPEYTHLNAEIPVIFELSEQHLAKIAKARHVLRENPEFFAIEIMTADPQVGDDPNNSPIRFGYSCYQVFATGNVYWEGQEKHTEDEYNVLLFNFNEIPEL